MQAQPSGRVVVIGAGMVGSSIAYSILNQEIAREIVIIDIAEDLAKANVLDMQDASQFTYGTNVKHGGYADLVDGDIVVITCGAAQKEGQTRQDLLQINAKIIREVVKSIKDTGKSVFIVMVTNPVDIMTYIAVKESGLPESVVFGSGTYLDTGRLRLALAEKLKVNHSNIHAYILGEHGDTSFPLLSNANVSGTNLSNLMEVNDALYDELMQTVRQKAYEIIKGKRATYFGIGNAVSVIVRTILRNENRILPISVMLNGQYAENDVCIGVPAKLSSIGYETIGDVRFNEKEKALFKNSVDFLKKQLELIK